MIELEDVSFGYDRGTAILSSVSWSFPPGRLCGLTGRSGRGKSTLLYIAGLLLVPWEGAVRYRGVEMSARSDRERSRLRAERIGFVFQDAMLDPARTVLDNVVEPAVYAGIEPTAAAAAARSLLQRFEVDLRADGRPGEISGGQAQRVALCRALVNDPEVVLADEPTGNLDRQSADRVIGGLGEMAHDWGKTVVVASHDRRVLSKCDAVLSLT